jgi:hypothetical protein
LRPVCVVWASNDIPGSVRLQGRSRTAHVRAVAAAALIAFRQRQGLLALASFFFGVWIV